MPICLLIPRPDLRIFLRIPFRKLTIWPWFLTSPRTAFLPCLTHSINSSIPFLHFFDGFRTSHEMSSIELISPEDIKSIFPFEKALEHKNRGVNPAHPYSIGVAYGDDVWMQTLQTHQPYYDAVPDKVQAAMDQVASIMW